MAINLLFWLMKKTDYNVFAKDFSETRKKPWPEIEFFQKYLQNTSQNSARKQDLLDIGTGNGRAIPYLENGETRVTGIDSSSKLIQLAKQLHPGKHFIVGDIEKLPFPDRSIDVLTAFACFPHLRNTSAREQGFRESFRVLKSGGVIFGTVWNLNQKQFSQNRKRAFFRSIFPFWNKNDFVIPWGIEKVPRLYYRFTEHSLRKYLEMSGFEDIEIFSIVHGKKAPPNMGKNICFLAKKPLREKVLSVPFDTVTFSQALTKMYESVQKNSQTFIITPNPEICMEAKKNPAFRHVLDSADISVADGMGILWATEYLHSPKKSRFLSLLIFVFTRKSRFLPERICGSDLFTSFCKRTRQPIFLLGSTKNVLEKCVQTFGNHIVGTDAGKSTPDDETRILQKINDSGARVLFVAFGAPVQENWIYKNRKKLPNIRLAVGIGGSFDFIAGTQKRAPTIFRTLGTEWLYRLFREPIKRGKRIWTAIWSFPKAVAEEKQKR